MLRDDDFKELADRGLSKVISSGMHFKYVNFHDGLEYILKTNTFKFTDPEDFNDPFDCNEQMLNIVVAPEIEKKFIIEAAAKHHLPRSEVRKYIKNIGNNNQYRKVLNQKKKEFKVTCFSEIEDDVLMWSHYADKHRGICIGFGLNIICSDYVLYPVNYLEKIKDIDGMANTPYVFYFLVTFKSHIWSYEREVRAISKTGQSIINYPKSSVREVIFGCNVKPSEIEKGIKELKKLKYKDIFLYQMRIDEKSMLLKKVPIKY